MVIGLTGTFSAGKDTVADYLKTKNFFFTSLSDFIRLECEKRGIPKDRDTLQKTANQMRALNGNDFFAKLAIQKIKEQDSKKSLVVSIRNIDELKKLRENPKFKLLAIDAPIELRYQRALLRESDKDKVSFEKFSEQKEKEMDSPLQNEMQMKTIIESADFKIENNGTIEELYKKIDNVLESLAEDNLPKIKIIRIDKTLPLPEYETKGAIAFDMYARIDEEIQPKEIKLVPANLIIEAPKEYFLMIAPRSSLSRKKGLNLANTIGIVDNDYCGPEDELCLQFYNFSDKPVKISRGERLAQAMFIKFTRASLTEVEEIKNESRGGFGSTGGYQK